MPGDGIRISNEADNTIIGGDLNALGNVISGNRDLGIRVSGAGTSGTEILGNFIGTNPAGATGLGNAIGIQIEGGASQIHIGAAGAGNTIAGNLGAGIVITGLDTDGNSIQGNFIGTNAAGATNLGNGADSNSDLPLDGIWITNEAQNTLVGGNSNALRNVISGNIGAGIRVSGAGTSGTEILGNFIGTNLAGALGLGNGLGILIEAGAMNNFVGISADGSNIVGNTIAGNLGAGIVITGSDTDNNTIQANFIGTNAAGFDNLGNGAGQDSIGDGIRISGGASGNTVGGTTDVLQNVISGNADAGVRITGVETSANRIQGNLIGLGVDGTSALGNGLGVVIMGGASGNFLGSDNDQVDDDLEGNQISNNLGAGVSVIESADNRIDGNTISLNGSVGISVTGAASTGNIIQSNTISGNQLDGVRITDLVPSDSSATDVLIGGLTETQANIIINNLGNGIHLSNSDGVQILGNLVGVESNSPDSTGNGNAGNGVFVEGSSNIIIGGLGDGEGNLVADQGLSGITVTGDSGDIMVLGNTIGLVVTPDSGLLQLGNRGDGVRLDGILDSILVQENTVVNSGSLGLVIRNTMEDPNADPSLTLATSVSVLGNTIGRTETDQSPFFGNAGGGILLQNVQRTIIGGTSEDDRNVISGNFGAGITLQDGSTDNTIQGNYIGTDDSGSVAIANTGDGITLFSNSGSNLIGGTTDGSENIISGNTGNGIYIYDLPGDTIVDGGSGGNTIQGNLIGTDATGVFDLGNTIEGILIETANNRIEGNVISGNDQNGLVLLGPGASNNTIVDNIIGLNADGTTALGNALAGVVVDSLTGTGAVGNIIGEDGLGNIISANGAVGIQVANIQPGSGDPVTQIVNNLIGTGIEGTEALGNDGAGIFIVDSSSVTISDNVIVDNGGSGVEIFDRPSNPALPATNNAILDNQIGVDINGDALGNRQNGVFLNQASGNTIGSPTSKNSIAANGHFGILVGAGDENTILANHVGGAPGLGNTLGGITLFNSSANQIGNGEFESRNVVSYNLGSGIVSIGTSTDEALTGRVNTIFGNLVGGNLQDGIRYSDASIDVGELQIAIDGNTVLGNQGDGIVVANIDTNGDPANVFVVQDHEILMNGGSGIRVLGADSTALTNNEVNQNMGDGLFVFDSESVFANRNVSLDNRFAGFRVIQSSGFIITTSRIDQNDQVGVLIDQSDSGTFDQNQVMENGDPNNGFFDPFLLGNGITLTNSSNVFLGGFASESGNLIAKNEGNGIFASNSPNLEVLRNNLSFNSDSGLVLDRSDDSWILGNLIGANGHAGDEKRTADGIQVVGSSFVGIGRPAAGQGNTIMAHEQGAGIRLLDASSIVETREVTIEGNTIGLNSEGSPGPNQFGIVLDDVDSITIGGSVGAGGNVISANSVAGIEIQQSDFSTPTTVPSIVITGNYIGPDATGTAVPPDVNGTPFAQATGISLINARNVQIGSTETAGRNVISGNLVDGISIAGFEARDNLVVGNIIGGADSPTGGSSSLNEIQPLTGPDGKPLDPTQFATLVTAGERFLFVPKQDQVQDQGIRIDGGFGNIVLDNAIAFNSTGIELIDSPSADLVRLRELEFTPNQVQSNLVGRNLNGVVLQDASSNEIGLPIAPGSSSDAGNEIVENISTGITLFGSGTTGNFITGNDILMTPPVNFIPPEGAPDDIGTGIFVDQVFIPTSPTILTAERNAINALLNGSSTSRAAILRNYIGLGTSGTGRTFGNTISGTPSQTPGGAARTVAGVYFFNGSDGNAVESNTVSVSHFGFLLINSAANQPEILLQGPGANQVNQVGAEIAVIRSAPPAQASSTQSQATPAGPLELMRRSQFVNPS